MTKEIAIESEAKRKLAIRHVIAHSDADPYFVYDNKYAYSDVIGAFVGAVRGAQLGNQKICELCLLLSLARYGINKLVQSGTMDYSAIRNLLDMEFET